MRGTLTKWLETGGRKVGECMLEIGEPVRRSTVSQQAFVRKHQMEEGLRKLSDMDLMRVWHDRKSLSPNIRGMMIRKVWDEHEIRFDGLTRQAVDIRIPFVFGLDTRRVKETIARVIEEVGGSWPWYIKEWHSQNMRITTTTRQNIADVMCNVTQPWKFGDGCVCQQVHDRLGEKGWNKGLPKVNGHIFLLGREYEGPCSEVLRSHACDVPKPTGWDVARVWESVREQLPAVFKEAVSVQQWKTYLEECREKVGSSAKARVNTAAVYSLRKAMNGLVCGPCDKNGGELWMVCPVLYKQAVDKLFDTKGSDYHAVQPKKVTAYRARKYKGVALLAEVSGEEVPKKNQRGGERDVIAAWARYYRDKGWNKIAAFNNKGRLGVPYALFKAKNITDPEVRKRMKWDKARPISPTFHHPMHKLLSSWLAERGILSRGTCRESISLLTAPGMFLASSRR